MSDTQTAVEEIENIPEEETDSETLEEAEAKENSGQMGDEGADDANEEVI